MRKEISISVANDPMIPAVGFCLFIQFDDILSPKKTLVHAGTCRPTRRFVSVSSEISYLTQAWCLARQEEGETNASTGVESGR